MFLSPPNLEDVRMNVLTVIALRPLFGAIMFLLPGHFLNLELHDASLVPSSCALLSKKWYGSQISWTITRIWVKTNEITGLLIIA